MVLLDLTPMSSKQLSTNLYFISDAIGKLLMIHFLKVENARGGFVHTMLEEEL